MIQIAYDNGNPTQIIERDRTNWKVTLILYSGDGTASSPYKPVIIGEGEGWDYRDAYNLAQADMNLKQ